MDTADDREGRTEGDEPDPILVECLAELADRIQSGRPLDLEELARNHPDQIEELRRQLPTIKLIAGLAAPVQGPLGPVIGGLDGTDRLGDFRLLRVIGCGGMGVVYEAEQVSLGRRVALKVLPFAAALDPRQLQRFRIEAQAAAWLHHTNIVPVHAIGNEGGVPYYAMQFIEGLSLAAVILEQRRHEGMEPPSQDDSDRQGLTWASEAASGLPVGGDGPEPEHVAASEPTLVAAASATVPGSSILDRAYMSRAAGLALQAAEALEHAHERGIVHRDIKPANLLLDHEGRLWVADFGLAQMKGDSQLTLSGDLLGTLRYMSPEQALGRRTPLDGRTDVYSLGASLYELLTLQPPFDGRDRAEIVRRVIQEEPTPPRRLNPAVPIDLETVVLKAMSKDVESRYPTAGELADDLRRFLEDRPVRARRPSLLDMAVKGIRRHRAAVAAATASVGLATVVLVGLLAWSNARQLAVIRQLETETARANRNKAEADAARVVAERHLLAAQLVTGQRAIEAGEFLQARSRLRQVQHIPTPWDSRELAWRAIRRATLRVINLGEEMGQEALDATASPDGQTLASFDPARPGVDLRQRETGQIRATLPAPGPIAPSIPLQFTPDGFTLGARPKNRPSEFWIWDVRTPRSPTVFTSNEEGFERLDLLADGRMLAIHTQKPSALRRLVLWRSDRRSAQPAQRLATLTESCDQELVSPDGRYVAVREPGWVRLYSAQDGSLRWSRTQKEPAPGPPYSGLSFTSDSKLLVALGRDDVVTVDTATGACTGFRIERHESTEVVNAFVPATGTLVLLDVAEGTIRLQSRVNRESAAASSLVPGTSETRQVVYEGASVRRRTEAQAVRSVSIRPKVSGSPPDVACKVSPDGTVMAVTARVVNRPLEPVTLWDLASGLLLATCPESHASLDKLFFTPDSRGLIFQFRHHASLWRIDEPDSLAGHADEAWGVAFSPDGTRLATGSDDTDDPLTIKIWDPATGRLLLGWCAGKGTVAALAYSPDGRCLASAHFESENNVKLWDARSGKLLAVLSGHTDRARTVVFSPDGELVASGSSDGTVSLWNARSRRLLLTFKGQDGGVQDLAFAPDGRTLALVGPDGLDLWDVKSRRRRFHRDSPHLMAMAYAPGGGTIAAVDEFGQAHLYQRETGKPLWTVAVAIGGLNALAFAPNGNVLVVGGRSGTIYVLDARSGAVWPGLEQSRVQINGLAFSPDGSTLASTVHDGSVRLWRDDD